MKHPTCEGDDEDWSEEDPADPDCDLENDELAEQEDGTEEVLAPAEFLHPNPDDDLDGPSDCDAASNASSGLEDAETDGEGSEMDEGEENHASDSKAGQGEIVDKKESKDGAGTDAKTLGPTSAKPKVFDSSPEWIQLKELEKDHKIALIRLPSIVGAGISRHPAKNFWQGRYPFCPTKSASWGSDKSPLACLVKVLKYVIKQHMSANPHDPEMHSWKSQLQNLEDIK